MSIFIPGNRLNSELTAAATQFDPGPILIHTDILKIGIIDRIKSREEICLDYVRVLRDVFVDRELLIPTFNYDFCRDGVYDVDKSKGQIGAFSTYMTEHYPHLRTLTPVFNFCLFGADSFSRRQIINPFGADSVFAQLHARKGTVAFLGAGFEANTFLHFVEESAQIEYRYIKVFEGEIIESGKRTPWKIDYRVRPQVEGAAEYDWRRILKDLEKARILKKASVGHGSLLWYNTGELFDFWISKIRNDPLYLLSETSRQVTRELYEQFGMPLTYEAMEQAKRSLC